jgi:tripartite-type tricarboxylate transporter receptor subunit TctC
MTMKMTRRYQSMVSKPAVQVCADETRPCLEKMNKTEGKMQSLTQLGVRMLSTAVIGVTLFLASGSPTEAYPVRPIKIVVGFAPGGSIDSAMRLIASKAEKYLGQPIIIENMPGAGGTVSYIRVSSSPPDGYTLVVTTLTVFRNALMQDVQYDPFRDFTYVAGLSNVSLAVITKGTAPWKTLAELIEFGKANAGKFTYGITGSLGSSGHLIMSEIALRENVNWLPVPYRGSPDTGRALLSGDIHAAADTTSAIAGQVDAGELRILATAGSRRSPRWPTTPTLKELGYDISIDSPWGLAGPAGLPVIAVQTLESAFQKALQDPDVVAVLTKGDQDVRYQSAADYEASSRSFFGTERALLGRHGLLKK